MNKFRAYIKSFRLRTLPLSLSGIFLGSMLAVSEGFFDIVIFLLAVLTTVCLQILSNISNELGDYLKGTDNENRFGPEYALSSGVLGVNDLKRMIVVFIALSCLFGTVLVVLSLGKLTSADGMLMIAVGGVSVLAALGYTLGKHPYGYAGFGDVAVFVFFGLVAVMGSFFLMSGCLKWQILLPASSCGLLAVGVLNVNNTRDIESDRANRKTIPVMIGEHGAKLYQIVLISMAFVCMSIYNLIVGSGCGGYIFWLLLPLFVCHLRRFYVLSGRELDGQLAMLSVSTMVLCIVYGVGQLI